MHHRYIANETFCTLFTGWFLVNIVAPLLLPVPPSRLRLTATVKDGQLCWGAIGISASAIYDVWSAVTAHREIPAWSGIALAGIILNMLMSMVVAAGGAVSTAPPQAAGKAGLADLMRAHSVFLGAIAMAVVAAYLAAELHFALAP